MRDPRIDLSKELVRLLTPLGLPMFSYVPTNQVTPYIYIGEIEVAESEEGVKDMFIQDVVMNVTLFSGDNEWIGSKLPLYNYVDGIKRIMQPSKGEIPFTQLEVFNMEILRLAEDTGFEEPHEDIRMYVINLAYAAMLYELPIIATVWNVIHSTDNVIYNLDNVIHNT